MKTILALFCLGLTTNSFAVDSASAPALQVQPLARSVPMTASGVAAKPAAMRRVPAPSVSETSVIRRRDGSLVVNCVQKPNPKLAQQMAAQQSAAHAVEPQQP